MPGWSAAWRGRVPGSASWFLGIPDPNRLNDIWAAVFVSVEEEEGLEAEGVFLEEGAAGSTTLVSLLPQAWGSAKFLRGICLTIY